MKIYLNTKLTNGFGSKCLVLIIILLFTHTVFAQPSISSFTPATGPIGTVVTITGAGFNTTPSKNIVYFGTVKAVVSAATSTSLTVTVPVGAGYLPLSVTTNNLIAYSIKPFILTFSGGGTITSNSFSAKIDSATGGSPYSAA